MDRRQRALVACVHRLEHVQGLGAPDLADDDPVGAHPQRVPDELADADLALALDVGRARLERDHVLLLELKLGGVLDCDDALVTGDEGRDCVQRRRLTGTCTTRDQDVELSADARGEKLGRLRGQRVERDQVVHRVRVARELPDRERRALEGEWRDDCVHSAAVRQARVDHRGRLIHAAPDLGDDLVDDPEEVSVVGEGRVGPLDLARPLDEDPVEVVDHHLGHVVVPEQGLEWPVTEDVVRQLTDDPTAFLAGEGRPVEGELLGDRSMDLLVQVLVRLGCEELRAELRDARVVDPRLQLCVRIVVRPLWLGVSRRRADELDRRCLAVPLAGPGAVPAFDAIVESHRGPYAFARACLRPQRFLDLDGDAGWRAFAISRTAREKSAFGSETTAGLPRLTASGTARSLGISKRTPCSSAASTSPRFIPTLVFALFRTTRMRSVGNERSSSVCRLSRTFLIVGTSSPHRSSSSSVRSSVASIGPWKNGEVSTTIISYDSLATSSSRLSFASVTSSASSGRTGAGRTSTPAACRVVYPASFSGSSSPGATTKS